MVFPCVSVAGSVGAVLVDICRDSGSCKGLEGCDGRVHCLVGMGNEEADGGSKRVHWALVFHARTILQLQAALALGHVQAW